MFHSVNGRLRKECYEAGNRNLSIHERANTLTKQRLLDVNPLSCNHISIILAYTSVSISIHAGKIARKLSWKFQRTI